MADTHETIAGIIAEMRALSNTISDGIIAINGRSIADRLETAHKRETDNVHRAMVILAGIEMHNPDDPPKLGTALEDAYNILSDALGTDGCTSSDYEEAKASGRHFVIQPRDEVVTVSNQLRRALELAMLYFSLSPEDGFRSYVKNGKIEMLHARNVLNAISSALAAPPRNCDRPECATTKAATDVWRKEDGGKTAYYEWLIATYKKGDNNGNK